MKTALVTGAWGFVGRHMTRALLDNGWDAVTCDVASPRRPVDCLDVFRSGDRVFDLVVHCAALAPHRAAIDSRPANMAYNLQLDSALLEWAVRTGQRRVLYLSSSAAYPLDLQDDFAQARELHEDDVRWNRLNIGTPDAAYGWTKLTGEKMAAAAAATGLPVHVVRPFSGYGEDQATDWPFGAFVDRARRRVDPFPVWGPGTQVRDWIHISDVVDGALAVVDADVRQPVNLCTGRGVSMTDLVTLICQAAGYDPQIEYDTARPAGVAYRVGDPDRLHSIYQPKVSLEEGVARAVGREVSV